MNFDEELAERFKRLAKLAGPLQRRPIHCYSDTFGYEINLLAGTEKHKRLVTLSDGNTYSVELEMTLEHR